jgi:dipeptidyl-peptidase-4
MTLNLLFRYPEIYKMGMSVAPVGNQLLYDNIYQERYMGLPSENREDFIEGSPMTYAENLKGNLLIVHGTGDDNVHYQNTEVVINELIKNNIQFDMMSYPNRSHGIYEGQNTTRHLYNLLTRYLYNHLEPGGKEVDLPEK